MTEDLQIVALVKGSERYVILFDEDRRAEAMRQLGRWASNRELSFSWYDAAVLFKRIRDMAAEENVAR